MIASLMAPFGRPDAYLLRGMVFALSCALAVAAGLGLLSMPLPEPPQHYRFTAVMAELQPGEWRSTTLPNLRLETAREPGDTFYRLAFEIPDKDAATPWAVFLPRFMIDAAVLVNGVEIADSRNGPGAGKPDRNIPLLGVIPKPLLRDGANELTVAVMATAPVAEYLESIYIGPEEALRPAYDRRLTLFGLLPVVLLSWQVIVGALLLTIWCSRPHEIAYGLLAFAMLFGVGRVTLLTLETPLHLALAGAALALEMGLAVLFALAFLDIRLRWWHGLVFLPSVLVLLIGFYGNPSMILAAYMLFGPPGVGLYLLLLAGLFGWSAIVKARGASFLLAIVVAAVSTGWAHDVAILAGYFVDHRYFVGRLFYPAMLIAIGTLLSLRFVQALNKIDSFAAQMVVKITETEDKLRRSFAREELQARNQALALERGRLMRDLHDGLGGQLVRIVALSERGSSERGSSDDNPIGEAARAALKDLRLVIDAMEDVGGDLLLALGSWRERTAIQLRAHHIELDWQVRTTGGLPPFEDLRPWHVIQIVRLMDEAITNAVKHSGAGRISVILRTAPDASAGDGPVGDGRSDSTVHIVIRDDGRGFLPKEHGNETGHGLANMQRRADLCQARLTIDSGPDGTSVALDLPRRFPPMPEAQAFASPPPVSAIRP
ncbi:histidine kinase [Agrobacterium sp. a22-2]|uniref:sensor histidine kinase n=1 Tax=Agrobacterium sp. a22-2 TaxID=2283840 RepID=UPI001446C777|nr:ATP-binding protein [Agrobacterium sp. a22-2]NKN39492.1 histidine kinase [Agrobacterium sp. a22-2]